MKNKKKLLVGAKILICAMFMMLTASVATASVATDFSFPNPIGTVMVAASSTDNLGLEFIMPDGVNNSGAEDTLGYDGSLNTWSGDTLSAFAANDYFLDNFGDGFWNPRTGVNPEAVWVDANSNGRLETGEIEVQGYADLETFNVTGNTVWVADSIANDSPVGTTGGSYNSADYDTNEALFKDVDGTTTLGPGDALIRNGAASVVNFDSPAANPGGVCGTGAGGCQSYTNVDDVYWCDGVGGALDGAYNSGESIFMDLIGNPTPGDYDPTLDVMLTDPSGLVTPAGCVAATGLPITLTSGGTQPVVFLDADKSGGYGDLSVSGPTMAPFIPAPVGEPIIDLGVPIGDQGILATTNIVAIAPAATDISFPAPDWPAFDAIPMNLAGGGNLKFIGGTPLVADTFNGTQAIVDENLGGTLGVLEPGEVVAGATSPIVGGLDNNFNIKFKYVDDGSGHFDSADDIYDESTGTTPFVLEKAVDELNAITIQNNGTMPQTSIAAVKLWYDTNVNGVFEPLSDTNIGTLTWDGVDSWEISGLSQAISAFSPGVNRFFVSVDIVASPAAGVYTDLFIPQIVEIGPANGIFGAGEEGVFVASANDGPTDALAIPASTNRLMTAGGGGGGGGAGGGSVSDCGDGILDSNETCDDGNRTAGDGCSVYCSLEDGYVWDAATESVITEEEAAAQAETTTEETTTTTEEATPETVTSETLSADDIAGVADNFSDYDETHWAAEYIAKLFLANIMTGYGDTDMFGVAEGTTRAEIVKIALLANGIDVPESVDTAPFGDTPLGEWYTPYVSTAADLGIVEGYEDGNFRPGNKVNRAEALKILLLAKGVDVEGYDTTSATNFSDVTASMWYAAYVAYAVDNSLVEGYEDGTFRGANDILRAEIAKLTVLTMLLDMAA